MYFDNGQNVIDCKTIAGFNRSVDYSSRTERYVIRRQYGYAQENGFKLRRTITSFVAPTGKSSRFYVVNYKITDAVGCSVKLPANSFQRAHGNSKRKHELYIRTKPSVMDAISKYARSKKPKQIISAVQEDAGGVFGMVSPCDVVRNREQVYNKIKHIDDRPKSRNTGKVKLADYGKVLSMLQDNDFVKDVSFSGRNRKGMENHFRLAFSKSIMYHHHFICSIVTIDPALISLILS